MDLSVFSFAPCGKLLLIFLAGYSLVYYTHRAALLIDQDFEPVAGSFSNFIRLDCNRLVCLRSKPSSHRNLNLRP